MAKTAPKAAKKKPVSEKAELLGKITKALGEDAAEAELKALRAYAATLGLGGEKPKAAAAAPSVPPSAVEHSSYLPKRLYLHLDGRGLDGRGMPVEVIDLPCVIGSSKRCNVWVNSTQIETRHLQISDGPSGPVIEDLGSEHGTLFEGKPLKKRVIQSGDEYLLAGYLRVRAEFN